ncbi:MAG: type IV toxin-antitoxin system AbiEi family antitoxin domain-containing protein [Actinomycetota bacterium]
MRDGNDIRRRDRLAALARKQHGVVELGQAVEAGCTRSAFFRHVRSGKLEKVFPRVYRVAGAPVSREQRAMAATLWAGRGSVASHDTAAELWGLRPAPPGVVHVTAPRQLTSPPRGIRTHVSQLPGRDRGKLRGVPVTGTARTVLDLAVRPDLAALVDAAVTNGLVTPDDLAGALDRSPGRRGSRSLRQVLDLGCDDGRWRSALERAVDELLRSSGLAPYEREFPVGPSRLDFAWPPMRVGLEADGRRWHSTQRDFARDRVKHNLLVASGWRVLRVTWHDVHHRPDLVAGELTRLLRAAPAPSLIL